MDYSGLVYSLTCDDPSLVYIGSSKYDDEGNTRFKKHSKDYNNYIIGKNQTYCSSIELFKVGNVKITVLEYVYGEPLKKAEQRHMDNNKCVNINRADRYGSRPQFKKLINDDNSSNTNTKKTITKNILHEELMRQDEEVRKYV
jgi:hypothetical protein